MSIKPSTSIHKLICGCIVLLAILLAPVSYAQIRSATITGTVMDTTGAVIPGIEVVLTNQNTNIQETASTTASGQYTFPYLPAGSYTVSINADGFSPYRQRDITLTTAQTVRADINLEVGAVNQLIEVTAQAAQIQTESATVQGAVQSDVIATLPNPTQNPLFYAMLQAGVTPNNSASDTTGLNSFGIGVDGRRQWSSLGVNGGRAWTNDIQLDGLPVMGGGYNEASVLPNTEGLQEVRIIANDFSAEYGRGQAVVAMSTKSGTNEYHGQGSYRLRNEALMANTYSNNANNVDRNPFKVHELGGAIGGPILRDKLFFFSSYHYLRYNYGSTSLMSVPTALERVGDFSQTNIRDSSGQAVAAMIFDPYNTTQIGTDLYQRASIPGAVITNANPYSLKMFTYYPDPNRNPDDEFNTNNFSASTINTLRRHTLNNRIDYRIGKHSIYGSGGIQKADNITPRPFGTAPLNNEPGKKGDRNPYAQIGDTIVVSPTVVVDLRYGINRIKTNAIAGNKTGWDAALYEQFGVPSNIQPYFALPGSAPSINPNGYSGGNGGGSNWTALSYTGYGNKREFQTGHNLTGSVTKINGSWTHKFGAEYRNLLSNYQDMNQQTASLPAQWFHQGGNFNFEYVTADGGVAGQNTSNQQRGVNGAAIFLGAPTWWIRPGANVMPAFSQKYFAVYSQNDWRATSKLTINLGLRWDLQPGPTERYNQMSGLDLDAINAFGYPGAIVFPGVDGYSRNLWNTQYNNIGPRLGFAYQVNQSTVVRGGYGITYLPSNTGYFSGPTDYGSASFSSGTLNQPYGNNPDGTPVMHFWDATGINQALGANPGASSIYGGAESKFDRNFKNGRAMQWNLFVERRISNAWFASVGYSASHSSDLMNRGVPVNSLQYLPQAALDAWRAEYIGTNGVTNPANVQVTNPFQPTDGTRYNFQGSLGAATLAQSNTLYMYPLVRDGRTTSRAWANYHSMQARLSHSFSNGFHLDVNYTWSKELDNTDTMADNQGQNSGGSATGGALDLKNYNNNTRVGFSDVPQRLAATFLVDLPFGAGQSLDVQNPVLRAIIGGWQTGGTFIAQSGFPFALSGASTGAAYPHPDRLSGVPLEVPKNLQKWYDGNTTVTLPNGRVIKPAKNTFLKYYSGAFSGRVVTLPNGKYQTDQFWYGTVASTLNGMRNPGRYNIDLSLRRSIKINERFSLDLTAEASNVLNHGQLRGSYDGNLGNTQTTFNSSNGLEPGMGQSSTFGAMGVTTFDPREVILNLKVRF